MVYAINFDDIDINEFVNDLFEDEDDMIVPDDGCLVGDHVICKVKDGNILVRHECCHDRITVTIVGRILLDENTWEYVAYIPEYEASGIKSIFKIRPEFAKRYDVHPKYIGEFGISLRKNNIIRISHRSDGMWCANCEEFYNKVEPNQKDRTFICYSCRQNPYR